MADRYSYVAVDKDGNKVSGNIIAENLEELTFKLSHDGKYLIKAKICRTAGGIKKIKINQLSDFLKQLGTLLEAGVSLVRALKIVVDGETISKAEKITYSEILRSVKQGNTLSDSLEKQKCFPELLLNMIRSAEMSGNLDKTLLNMSEHYSKQHKLNQKIKGSLTYSKVLGVVIVVAVFVIVVFVLPMFNDLFAGMTELPLATRLLLGISDFVGTYWAFLIVFCVIAFFLLSSIKNMPKVRLILDKLKVKMPVFGELNKKIYTSRFAATLSALYSSGIPMITAIQVSKNTIGNAYLESQFDNVISSVRSGGTLSGALSKIDGFVKKLESSIFIGEETGYLDSMLKSVSDMLDYESEMATAKLVSFIEPAMIVIMAVIVGFIMIAVLSPIYGSYGAIGAGYL